MVKKLLCAACLLLTLTACGKARFDPVQVKEKYVAAQIETEYTVTTHAGFFTQYRLSCSSADGASRVTILEPASVAGISATLEGENAVLQYEDVALDALLPKRQGYAPADALHFLLEDLKSAMPESWGREEDLLVLEYVSVFSDNTQSLKRVFLTPETLDLQGAELYLENSLILSIHIDDTSAPEG